MTSNRGQCVLMFQVCIQGQRDTETKSEMHTCRKIKASLADISSVRAVLSDALGPSKTRTIQCSEIHGGRFVSIFLDHDGILTLCEVKVFGCEFHKRTKNFATRLFHDESTSRVHLFNCSTSRPTNNRTSDPGLGFAFQIT